MKFALSTKGIWLCIQSQITMLDPQVLPVGHGG